MMSISENRPPGVASGQAAKSSWGSIGTRLDSGTFPAKQPHRSLARLALEAQAPAYNLKPTLVSHLKRQLGEAIVDGDDATAARLRTRLDQLLDPGGR
jgi:hypothetical protein